MSLEGYVFENDEWVSRTISADELLRASNPSKQRTERTPLTKPPTCGLLARTIVDSPIIRWVLPVQLRSARYNDVALIGDHSVQICELAGGRDRQLHDIVRKQDFGSRIRNAVVMGSPQYPRRASQTTGYYSSVKSEDSDAEMIDLGTTAPGSQKVNSLLPPQLLVLVLERGDLVFLFLQQGPGRTWEFVSSIHQLSEQQLVRPGFHMAIDPSSQFLALACSEHIFIVLQLQSMETLRTLYSKGHPLNPIKDKFTQAAMGIIHKIEFLHPTHGNEIQVILMIIIVHPKISRMAIYEWDSRFGIEDTFTEEKLGYKLKDEYRMPLLVVPLKVKNAFLVITERITAICSDILGGGPSFVEFELVNRGDTELHHGTREPLWTAWTRPIRHPPYHDRKDVIYLAREDGLINFLEYGDESEIETSVSMGSVDCNIDTAFTCLFHLFGDVLVTGGDSGPGAVWNVEARQSPQRIGSIPNWSPTVDFAVTNDLANGIVEGHGDSSGTAHQVSNGNIIPLRQDKIFACSGRGITGAITEFRYGIQARIGLDLTYSSYIKQCWSIPDFNNIAQDGFLLLLALPNESTVLHLSLDLSEASEKDQNTTPYDLSSRTLAVQKANGLVVQITTNSITVVNLNSYSRNSTSEFMPHSDSAVADAAIGNDTIALAVYTGPKFSIVLLSIVGLELSVKHTFDVEGEVTCLAVETVANSLVILAGLWQGGDPALMIHPTEQGQNSVAPMQFMLQSDTGHSTENTAANDTARALTSIVYLGERSGKATIVGGTRDGDIITLELDQSQPGSHRIYRDRFGMSPSYVYSGNVIGDSNSVFVCSDAELAIMSTYVTTNHGNHFEETYRVWPTEGDRPSMSSPSINAIATLSEQIPECGEPTLIMISGPRIMVTELQRRPKPVPRYFPIGGSPVKILYHSKLDALVTIVSKNEIPSLHFIDPATGCDLSQPLERKKLPSGYSYSDVDYITGLGNEDFRAVSLTTWAYKSGGIHGDWIVLALRKGARASLLLIISAETKTITTETGMSRRVRFWTKFERKFREGAISSVATNEQGVFICAGNNVQYHVIENGKFTVVKRHNLPSPASWMQVIDGRLNVLTTKHSLVVLDYASESLSDGKQMVRLHTDDTCRSSLHSIEISTPSTSMTMLSDPMCGIHGLWTPSEFERPLALVFQAELQASVRKFAQGYTRTSWGLFKNRPRYGCFQSGFPGSDILGLTIDGSLQHFSLLSEDAWRFLRFIQNLALTSTDICPHASSDLQIDESSLEPNMNPKINLQVDGNILQRCLDRHALEGLASNPEHLQRIRELLKPLDEDKCLSSSDDDKTYFELAYKILKYYLLPVL